MGDKTPSQLEIQLHSSGSLDAFKAALDATSEDEQLAVLRKVTSGDYMQTTTEKLQKVAMLYQRAEKHHEEVADYELVTAAHQAKPEIVYTLLPLVTNPTIREEAVLAAAGDAEPDKIRPDYAAANIVLLLNAMRPSPEFLFEAMEMAVQKNAASQLEEITSYIQHNHPNFFCKNNAFGSKLILDALNATDHAGFEPDAVDKLPASDRQRLADALLDAGAIPLPLQSETGEKVMKTKLEDPFYITDTEKNFPVFFVQKMERVLFTHQRENRHDATRRHYRTGKAPASSLWQAERKPAKNRPSTALAVGLLEREALSMQELNTSKPGTNGSGDWSSRHSPSDPSKGKASFGPSDEWPPARWR